MSPLHLAVKQTSAKYPIVDVMKALLSRQIAAAADVNSRDAKMQTPLHYAAVYCNDHSHVIKLLLDRYVGQQISHKYMLLLYCPDYMYKCSKYAVAQSLV